MVLIVLRGAISRSTGEMCSVASGGAMSAKGHAGNDEANERPAPVPNIPRNSLRNMRVFSHAEPGKRHWQILRPVTWVREAPRFATHLRCMSRTKSPEDRPVACAGLHPCFFF